MEDKMQWFVVNVHTSCEDKVARELREQIDKRKLNAFFGEILVPTREVSEIKGGKRVKTEKKFFCGGCHLLVFGLVIRVNCGASRTQCKRACDC